MITIRAPVCWISPISMRNPPESFLGLRCFEYRGLGLKLNISSAVGDTPIRSFMSHPESDSKTFLHRGAMRSVGVQSEDTIDWRDFGILPPVRATGLTDLPFCVPTAVIASIEAIYAIEGQKVDLSVQELIDCNTKDIIMKGGWDPVKSFHYIEKYGIGLASDMPYVGKEQPCTVSELWEAPRVYISGFVYLRDPSVETVKDLLKKQPLIAVVNSELLDEYDGGLIKKASFHPLADPDHAVLLVGTGIEDDCEYFIAMDNMGIHFGEKGFSRFETSYFEHLSDLRVYYPELDMEKIKRMEMRAKMRRGDDLPYHKGDTCFFESLPSYTGDT